jgi:hypothetical protein
MTEEMSCIILRNVPKEETRIDGVVYEIEGGFRGFRGVPSGAHYVSVKIEEKHKGFWCYLEPNQALVKAFNTSSQQFEDDEPNTTEHYQQLALSGAMDQALITYDEDAREIWQELTKYITCNDFPPTLHQEEIIQPPTNLSPEELSQWMLKHHKSRFEQALFDTHQGNINAFLGEFQFTFARWYIDSEDTTAFNRWSHLLEALYNAGERGIRKATALFTQLIDILILQFDCLPGEVLNPDSVVISGAEYLAEDMLDSDVEEVVKQGEEFNAYLEERGIVTE